MVEEGRESDSIKILIADDQPIIRRGIALLLSMEEDIDIVGQAMDCEDAIEQARQLKPHIVLMDLQMPRLNRVAATRRSMEKLHAKTVPSWLCLSEWINVHSHPAHSN